MRRLPKWLLMKEWLTYEDVTKVLDIVSSELENVFSRDESDELKHLYKFVCTFSPRECQREFREYRFENTARTGMRAHLKDHINSLKINSSVSGDLSEFLTRNQLYQKGKAQKHKLPSCDSGEGTSKRAKTSSLPGKCVTKSDPLGKKKRFTKLKRTTSTENENPQSFDTQNDDVVPPQCNDEIRMNASPIDIKVEEIDQIKVENDIFPTTSELKKQKDKTSCQTQTECGKEVETLQYKITTRLFAVDRSQWGNIEQVLDDLIRGLNAVDKISKDARSRILDGMAVWMGSVRLYDQQSNMKVQEPLSKHERDFLNKLTKHDWAALNKSKEPESKLRLTVYANMLLRDYEFYPRKFKPKVCRHCAKTYTASTSLYSHLLSLSGIRYWLCSRCKDPTDVNSTFTRKHSLQYHIMKDVGIPRYECSQPGCSKTHNHTHHQKSHARQHTGEKHYVCQVDGCEGQFSNRNTYSRHLLQIHCMELSRNNALKVIDEKTARCKVQAARLKARERSKVKRQRLEGGPPVAESGKSTEQRALTHISNQQNEGSPSTNVIEPEVEKFMGPTASQLLTGIARDVRNSTSTFEDKNDSRMLGGLNLLATVSKYMNVEETAGSNENRNPLTNNSSSSSSSYTRLIEALDIHQSSSRNYANLQNANGQVPIISSLGLPKPDDISQQPSTSGETATVIAKPSVLLPLPTPKKDCNIPKQDASQSQNLPNVIQSLKKRIMNPPKYEIAPQQLVQSSAVQVAVTSHQTIAQKPVQQFVQSSAVQVAGTSRQTIAQKPVQQFVQSPAVQMAGTSRQTIAQKPVQVAGTYRQIFALKPLQQFIQSSAVQVAGSSRQSIAQFQSSAVQVAGTSRQTAGQVIQPGSGKIIVNLAQPASTSPSLVFVDKMQGSSNVSILNTSAASSVPLRTINGVHKVPARSTIAAKSVHLRNPAVTHTAPLPNAAVTRTVPLRNPAVTHTAPLPNAAVTRTVPLRNPAVTHTAPLPNAAVTRTVPFHKTAVTHTAPLPNAAVTRTAPFRNPAVTHTAPLPLAAVTRTAPFRNKAVTHTTPLPNTAVTRTVPFRNPAVTHTAPLPNAAVTRTIQLRNTAATHTVTLRTAPVTHTVSLRTATVTHTVPSRTNAVTHTVPLRSTMATNTVPLGNTVAAPPQTISIISVAPPTAAAASVPLSTLTVAPPQPLRAITAAAPGSETYLPHLHDSNRIITVMDGKAIPFSQL